MKRLLLVAVLLVGCAHNRPLDTRHDAAGNIVCVTNMENGCARTPAPAAPLVVSNGNVTPGSTAATNITWSAPQMAPSGAVVHFLHCPPPEQLVIPCVEIHPGDPVPTSEPTPRGCILNGHPAGPTDCAEANQEGVVHDAIPMPAQIAYDSNARILAVPMTQDGVLKSPCDWHIDSIAVFVHGKGWRYAGQCASKVIVIPLGSMPAQQQTCNGTTVTSLDYLIPDSSCGPKP